MVNPRTVTNGGTIQIVRALTDANNDGRPDNDAEVRAFNGNRIRLTFRPDSGFAVTKTITIDDVNPSLVTTSPAIPLVVKGGVDVTFTADITDGGSGYTETNTATAGINQLTDAPGTLATDGSTPNHITDLGGVRLVVAGNVVALGKDNFTAIDNGWRVSQTLDSTSIQNIGANVPWYFETRDRAGNTRRTSGSIALSVGDSISNGANEDTVDLNFIDTRVQGRPASEQLYRHRGTGDQELRVQEGDRVHLCSGHGPVYGHDSHR